MLRLLKLLVFIATFTLMAVSLWTFLWPVQTPDQVQKADVIVCLGSGYDAEGNVDPAGQKRAALCIDLYKAGVASKIIFTGGTADPKLEPFGSQMREDAVSQGVQASDVVAETQSNSTLQNALYAMPFVNVGDDIILVSEAFHLPRSWASFKWAGAEEVTLVASEPVRRNPATQKPRYNMLVREAAAIWFNLGRATLWSTAALFGKQNDDWLF